MQFYSATKLDEAAAVLRCCGIWASSQSSWGGLHHNPGPHAARGTMQGFTDLRVHRQTKENPMSRWSIHRALAFRSVLVLAYIALYGPLGYTGSGEVGAQSVGAVSSALVPAKFQATTIATGMTSPTAMATAPDGRIFVTQQDGRVRLLKNDVLLTEDF